MVAIDWSKTAGINAEQFLKYVEDKIMKLSFPDTADIPGRLVLFILDSNPGRR